MNYRKKAKAENRKQKAEIHFSFLLSTFLLYPTSLSLMRIALYNLKTAALLTRFSTMLFMCMGRCLTAEKLKAAVGKGEIGKAEMRTWTVKGDADEK